MLQVGAAGEAVQPSKRQAANDKVSAPPNLLTEHSGPTDQLPQ